MKIMETKKKTFDELQVGDLVIVERMLTKTIHKIAKVTKTQIILDNGDKYKRNDGRPVGSTSIWCTTKIVIPTDEMIKDIREENYKRNLVRNVLNHLSPDNITYEQALKISEILNIKNNKV